MNAEEYKAISDFLTHNVYPKYVQESKKTCHAKKNFRVKASQYMIGEDNKIFKVVFFFNEIDVLLIIYSEIYYRNLFALNVENIEGYDPLWTPNFAFPIPNHSPIFNNRLDVW